MFGAELGEGEPVFGQALPSQTSSGCEKHLNLFPKNIAVMVME